MDPMTYSYAKLFDRLANLIVSKSPQFGVWHPRYQFYTDQYTVKDWNPYTKPFLCVRKWTAFVSGGSKFAVFQCSRLSSQTSQLPCNCEPGPCITNVFATRRKNFSQWHRSFQRKLLSHWLKFLRHVWFSVVRSDDWHTAGGGPKRLLHTHRHSVENSFGRSLHNILLNYGGDRSRVIGLRLLYIYCIRSINTVLVMQNPWGNI